MRFSRIVIAFVAIALVTVAVGTTNGQEAASNGETIGQTIAATATAPFLTSLDAARSAAAEKDQNILLDFYTDW